ncbi:MAG: transposase family protein [Deltaproteobacteria bacterium]|nr:transposase family protein [Deltaproteobacteria bacterium]
MDFFTIDTIFGKRFYCFFIIRLLNREIVSCNLTTNPTELFVKNQIIEFSSKVDQEKIYLIHDRDSAFSYINYEHYGIKNVMTSVKAPNMNAFAERLVKSIRNEAFDWYVLFNETQIRNILNEYITYYNSQRPHQGIDQNIPQRSPPQIEGEIVAKKVLSGLCHHYHRKIS